MDRVEKIQEGDSGPPGFCWPLEVWTESVCGAGKAGRLKTGLKLNGEEEEEEEGQEAAGFLPSVQGELMTFRLLEAHGRPSGCWGFNLASVLLRVELETCYLMSLAKFPLLEGGVS